MVLIVNFNYNGYNHLIHDFFTTAFHAVDVTTLNGMRAGTYECFIKPIVGRRNLQIYRFAHVTKIELDENLHATGVTYVRDGKILTATATKEIIISAGAIGTPHLLLLSGIGPAADLVQHDVKTFGIFMR